MELILEFLVEVVFERLMDLMQNPKVPLIIRVFIYLAYSSFLLGLSGLFIYFALHERNRLFMIGLFVIAIFLFVLFVFMTKKVFRK